MLRLGSRSIWRLTATSSGAVPGPAPRVRSPPPNRLLAGPSRGRSLSPLRSGRTLSLRAQWPSSVELRAHWGEAPRAQWAALVSGRAHQARRGPAWRPISTRARRPGGGGGNREAQSDPGLRGPLQAPGLPGGERVALSGRAGLSHSVVRRPGPGGERGRRASGTEGEAGAGWGTHRAVGEIPQQVQWPSGTATPARPSLSMPRAPGGLISECRGAAPPRQSLQIGGAAAPRVTAGPRPTPLPFSFLLPSAAPRDAFAAPGPLRRGRLPTVVCREKTETPERGRRSALHRRAWLPQPERVFSPLRALSRRAPTRLLRPGLVPACPEAGCR